MLQSLIGKIGNLDSKTADELKELIGQYPYCQALNLLYSINLANIHSTNLKEQVELTSIVMPDRLKLCQSVSNGEFEWIELLNEIERNRKESSVELTEDFSIIDRFLAIDDEPIQDNLITSRVDVECAEYTMEESDEDNSSSIEPDEQDQIINTFLEADMNGNLFVPQCDIPNDSNDSKNEEFSLDEIREKTFLSESLAKLYVKQHKYEQALAIFLSLNLKYSQKFTYFADQIRYLEAIIAYQKGEETKIGNN